MDYNNTCLTLDEVDVSEILDSLFGQDPADLLGVDAVVEFETFLFGTADDKKGHLDLILDKDPPNGQTVSASNDDLLSAKEDANAGDLKQVKVISGLNFDVLPHEATNNDGLCQLLAVNRKYQAALRKLLQDLYERRAFLDNQRHVWEEEIRYLKANSKNKVTPLTLSQFGYPYFKDKNGKPLGVYTERLELNRIFKFKPAFYHEKPLQMVQIHEEKLKQASRISKLASVPPKRVLNKSVLKTPRGRPKQPNSALDDRVAERFFSLKAIRHGRRRKTSLPDDGRVNGMALYAIQNMLPLKTERGSIPHEASHLVATGIAERDVGTVQKSLTFPGNTADSKLPFPANLASLAGLRGIKVTEEKKSQSAEVEIEDGVTETEVEEKCSFGDPVQDEKLLEVFGKIFGSWAKPCFGTEAVAASTSELRTPQLTEARMKRQEQQELYKQHESFHTAMLERERKRQHTAVIKPLEAPAIVVASPGPSKPVASSAVGPKRRRNQAISK